MARFRLGSWQSKFDNAAEKVTVTGRGPHPRNSHQPNSKSLYSIPILRISYLRWDVDHP